MSLLTKKDASPFTDSLVSPNPKLMDTPHDWTMSDQAQADFLPMKYRNRDRLGEEAHRKRKLANANEFMGDGKKNPHHPRMELEATVASMAFDISYLVESNCILQQQVNMLSMLFERVGLLEGAYAYLQQSTDHVKNLYKDSVKKHYEERKEYSTRTAMQRAGLDPESKADRLRWAQRLDDLTASIFKGEEDDANR